MKRFILAAALCVLSVFTSRAELTGEQIAAVLTNLASEYSKVFVGTPDRTFRAITYEDGKFTFTINPESEVARYRMANPTVPSFYERVLAGLYAKQPKTGIELMEFLRSNNRQIRFIIPGVSEETIVPGDVLCFLQPSEPLYQGVSEADKKDKAEAGNVRIEKGADLVAVLKAAKGVTYDYNLDSGIWAVIGDVAILIEPDQLNQAGERFFNSFESDMASDVPFRLDYIKPGATIRTITEY